MNNASAFKLRAESLKQLFGYGSLMIAGLLPAVAHAQSPSARQSGDSSSGVVENPDQADDIVVTASGRAQKLEKVPASAVVYDAEQLTQSNIDDVASLSQRIANVSAYGSNRNNQTFAIRGIAALTGSYSGSPYNTFGVYLDGLNLSPIRFQQGSRAGDTANSGLFEVERVEVLRGPQGTYFGRNVLGGAISIISKKPSNHFEADLSAEISSFKGREFRAMVNLPASDALAIRISARRSITDGPVRNLGPRIFWSSLPSVAAPATFPDEMRQFKRRGDDRSSSAENESLRAAARLRPADWLTLDFAAQYDSDRYGISPTVQSGIFDTPDGAIPEDFLPVYGDMAVDPLHLGTYFSGNQRRAAYSGANSQWSRGPRLSANLNIRIGTAAVELITSYRELKINYITDEDFSLARSLQNFDGFVNTSNFSQEARLTWSIGPFEVLAGGFYARDKEVGSTVQFSEGLPPEGLLTEGTPLASAYTYGEIIGDRTPRRYRAYAAFGELGYQLNEAFRITGGLRYSIDQTSGAGFDIEQDGTPTDYVYYLEPYNIETKKLTYRVSLQYEPTRSINIYGTISTGHRPGIPNLGNSVLTSDGKLVNVTAAQLGVPNVLRPEELVNMEVGFKGRLFDQIGLNVAAFHMRYKGIQGPSRISVLAAVPNPQNPNQFLNINDNLGGARINGVETELNWQVTDRIRVESSIGYLHSKLDPFEVVGVGNVGGRSLPLARRWSGAVRASYELDIVGVNTNISAEFVAASRVSGDLNAYTPGRTNPLDYLPKLSIFNGYINLKTGNSWSVDAVVNNIFDRKYWTSVSAFSPAGAFLDVNPRTLSIRLGRRF